ncbi:DNA-processing protein DprA [Sutcliffiella rhizosphaerae]|uniref:DNA processing protein DprA n=1 Tax=Sutcliffiella rhizosphaerae TaxID=2880967 RepID=A0ABM8YIK9_9BACI|nr:DNA-processing protein DprA [Sutcliffiella rhizosphaerae]CAG9619723.1 DNA processing protein DprA [Sutcliffiella rhizosphaerae]
MKKLKNRLLILHHCPHISSQLLRILLQKDPTLENIFNQSPSEIMKQTPTSMKKAQAIHHYLQTNQVSTLLKKYHEHNIQSITIFDEDYPPLLKEIFDPPLVLFVKGKKTLLKHRMLGVVGSRGITSYGAQSLEKLLPALLIEPFVIVSGLARGVDIYAHKLTIRHGGNTIAVLGGGILCIYPKEHQPIAEWISHHQLLISEYPPYEPPKKWNFPERNRIISGLSEGVIVIEAKEKSGSLITADQALEQGREVFAIPGSIHSDTSRGTNALIKQGAKLVENPQDILEELPRDR